MTSKKIYAAAGITLVALLLGACTSEADAIEYIAEPEIAVIADTVEVEEPEVYKSSYEYEYEAEADYISEYAPDYTDDEETLFARFPSSGFNINEIDLGMSGEGVWAGFGIGNPNFILVYTEHASEIVHVEFDSGVPLMRIFVNLLDGTPGPSEWIITHDYTTPDNDFSSLSYVVVIDDLTWDTIYYGHPWSPAAFG